MDFADRKSRISFVSKCLQNIVQSHDMASGEAVASCHVLGIHHPHHMCIHLEESGTCHKTGETQNNMKEVGKEKTWDGLH